MNTINENQDLYSRQTPERLDKRFLMLYICRTKGTIKLQIKTLKTK